MRTRASCADCGAKIDDAETLKAELDAVCQPDRSRDGGKVTITTRGIARSTCVACGGRRVRIVRTLRVDESEAEA